MDGNREEAIRCLEMAKKEFAEFQKDHNNKQKFEKVVRLANKSERMYPSMEAKKFLNILNSHHFARTNNEKENLTRNKPRFEQRFGANNFHNGTKHENGKFIMS